MLRRIFAGALAFALLASTPMLAATTTISVPLSQSAYTDLGIGPMLVGANGGTVIYQVGDAADATVAGHVIYVGSPPRDFSGITAHVWALGSSAGVKAIVTSGTGIISGGGGGGGGGGSVTQGTSPWVVDGSGVTQPVSGTSLSTIATNTTSIANDDFAVSGSVSSAATLFTQDMLGYNSVSVQITANASANTITFETSDDNANWLPMVGLSVLGSGSTVAVSTSTGTNTMYRFPKAGRYFRARVSTFIGGTTTVVGNLHKVSVPVAQSTTALSAGAAVIGALTANQSVNTAQVNGVTTLAGTGAVGTGAQRVAVGTDTATIAGSAPGTAGSASTNVLSVQGIASMTPMLVNPGTAANFGVGATGSAVPANGVLGMASNAGTAVALQGDATSGLWVNIKAGAGSGGTALADNAAFTQSTTNETPFGCLANSGAQTSATAGHSTVVACTLAGSVHTTVDNTNANGQTTMSASSPIVIASDQSAVAVKAASGALASGSIASGAVASGAIASGAFASGSISANAAASGAFPAGAISDLAHGSATSANSVPVVIASDQGAVQTKGAVNVTPTDCSVTLTTGGTAQNAFTAQTTLHGFTIANTDNTTGSGEPVWFSFTGTAAANAAGSYPLAAATATTYAGLSSYTTPAGFGTNHALSVIAATTSHKISCTWW